MRLIRTCAQPANMTLSRQFQLSQVFKNPVSLDTSNLERGSNIQWFARSYGASASSERMETKNSRRRISKDERKSMVESFVKKYREMNAGKFPTVSEAMKDVGGSYYVIRGFLQELVHKAKMPPVDKREALSEKIAIEKDDMSYNTGEISLGKDMGERECISSVSNVETRGSSSESSKSDQQPEPSILVELCRFPIVHSTPRKNDESNDFGIGSPNSTDELTSGLHLDSKTDMIAHEDERKFDGSQSKTELPESKAVPGRELHEMPSGDAKQKIQTTLWQNLKSFANGIFGMWKS